MHSDAILAVCAVLTLVGGVALALIQVGIARNELTRMADSLERMEREGKIDEERLRKEFQREVDGIHRELSDLRGQMVRRGPK